MAYNDSSDNCLTGGLTDGKAQPQPAAPKIPSPFKTKMKTVPFKQSQEPNPPGGINFQS